MSNDVTQRHCTLCGTLLKDSEKRCPICFPNAPPHRTILSSDDPPLNIKRGRPPKKPQDPKSKDPPKEPEIKNTNPPEKPQKPNSVSPPSPGPSSSPKPPPPPKSNPLHPQHNITNLEQSAQIVKELILQGAFKIAKDFIDFIAGANGHGTQD